MDVHLIAATEIRTLRAIRGVTRMNENVIAAFVSLYVLSPGHT